MVLDVADLQNLGVKMYDQSEMLNNDDTDQLSASDESEPEEQPSRGPFDPELDHSDDDDDDDDGEAVVCAPAAVQTAQSSFSLSGGSSAFSDRSHSIFDCLDSVDRQTFASLNQENVTDRGFAQLPLPSRKTSHPPSSCPIPPKKRGIPDYLVHPERWTHYNLEDVIETSDQDNSRVALQFLSSLQQERKSESFCDIQQRMIFSRPKQLLKVQPADQLSTVRGRERAMHLGHLEEEDEDDDSREREKAGGRRTEQSVEKTVEREKDEEKDLSGDVGQVEEKKRVQTAKKIEESTSSFSSFRKMKSKNYRKSSGHEDN